MEFEKNSNVIIVPCREYIKDENGTISLPEQSDVQINVYVNERGTLTWNKLITLTEFLSQRVSVEDVTAMFTSSRTYNFVFTGTFGMKFEIGRKLTQVPNDLQGRMKYRNPSLDVHVQPFHLPV